jgi:hypothetical protein
MRGIYEYCSKILVPIDFSQDSTSRLNMPVVGAKNISRTCRAAWHKKGRRFLRGFTSRHGRRACDKSSGCDSVDRLLSESVGSLLFYLKAVKTQPAENQAGGAGEQSRQDLEVAKEENIDLVVLAVRKQSFIPYLITRGRFLQMISRMPCPVPLKPSWSLRRDSASSFSLLAR